jgi:hypothetical protein
MTDIWVLARVTRWEKKIRLARKAKPKRRKIEQLNRTSVNDTTNVTEIDITTKIAVLRHYEDLI